MANRVTKVREVVEIDDSLLPAFKKAAGGVFAGCSYVPWTRVLCCDCVFLTATFLMNRDPTEFFEAA